MAPLAGQVAVYALWRPTVAGLLHSNGSRLRIYSIRKPGAARSVYPNALWQHERA